MKDDDKTLTTRQGHAVADNQTLRSVGERGPATLENYQFIEKITHSIASAFPERSMRAARPTITNRRASGIARSRSGSVRI
jgi:catalase